MPEIDPLHLFYALGALAVVLAAEAFYLLFYNTQSYRSGVNRRLVMTRDEPDREKVLVKLRRERGLTAEGGQILPMAALNRLVVQSGLRVSAGRVALLVGASALIVFLGVLRLRGSPVEAAAAACLGAVALPLFALAWMRKRRRQAFGERFPEAIDIIVRSLRAGHPVPVAISTVGRQLPDPVGTEFGLVSDEITYGADMETALRTMMGRVGQEDLPLFVTSVGIQATTGGNLSQILDNLSKVIRERFKMRRKIRGLSAEGRASAMILNLTPLCVFLLINWINPSFYGEIWDKGLTQMILAGAVGWMLVGNVIMRRMINFEI